MIDLLRYALLRSGNMTKADLPKRLEPMSDSTDLVIFEDVLSQLINSDGFDTLSDQELESIHEKLKLLICHIEPVDLGHQNAYDNFVGGPATNSYLTGDDAYAGLMSIGYSRRRFNEAAGFALAGKPLLCLG